VTLVYRAGDLFILDQNFAVSARVRRPIQTQERFLAAQADPNGKEKVGLLRSE
jgi:hypothetical protein